MTRAIVLSAVLFSLVGCAADSSGFPVELVDSTCAEILCGWSVAQGNLVPSGSWHEHQRSLELSGPGARVTRRISGMPSQQCFGLTFLADIEADAQLELQLDFNDDNTIDARALVPVTRWRTVEIGMRPPVEYRSVRVSLEKQGPGSVRISSLTIQNELDYCKLTPPTTLSDGAQCSADQTCRSGRCVLGKCASCGPSGCAEGEACRTSDECLDGACASGVCKACAKRGDCATGQGCSITGQCASGSCVHGGQPSLNAYPGLDGICGDCDADNDCGGGRCVLGRCSLCATDSDCPEGRVCRYADTFDVSTRACLPRITSVMSRGALCERDGDCQPGLRCGATDGRAKRCGISCVTDSNCGIESVCAAPGVSRDVVPPAKFVLLPGWSSSVPERVSTCYPRSLSLFGTTCQVQEQCTLAGEACCSGSCTIATLDPDTNTCVGERILPP